MKFSLILIPLLTLFISVLTATPVISSTANLLHPSEGKGSVKVDAGNGKPGGATTFNVGGEGEGEGEGVSVHSFIKGKPVRVDVPANFFFYGHYASEIQVRHGPDVVVFFLEKDLKAGHKMKFQFPHSSNQASFLPPELANSIPFSSAKLDDILKMFDIEPESEDAEIMKKTLKQCGEEGIRGEEKYCATSLESMVDFATSRIGKKVEAMSTEVVKDPRVQEYKIAAGVEKVGEEKVVACHRQEYPYAVFFCHKTQKARAYTVPLEGDDGVRVKAVAACHADTSEWNPKHLAFHVLKVKPGTVPVCHFLPPQDHLIWVPKRLEML